MIMDKALQTMIDNMPAKTGKSLEEWKAILKGKAFAKHGEAMKFLKEDYGLTHGYANTIILISKEGPQDGNELLEQQYKGKENLLPVYEQLIATATRFGSDVTITPKKDSVSIIRKKQFALIKPATIARIDLGLKLRNKPEGFRLGPSGPFGTMCTHRVQLSAVEEVDTELEGWLREAYLEAE